MEERPSSAVDRAYWHRVALLAVAQALALALIAALTHATVLAANRDVALYYSAARRILGGLVPYRDFRLEYPPGALLAFLAPRLVLPGLSARYGAYGLTFAGLMVACSVLTTLAVAALAARLHAGRAALARVAACALLSVALAPVLLWRFDALPALLSALALLAAARGRPWLAGLLLGLGGAVKLYPLVLVAPLALAWLAAGWRRQTMALVLAAGAAFLLPLSPFLVFAGRDALVFLTYHSARGLQLEAVAGGLLELGRLLGLARPGIVFDYGAFHLVSPLADALKAWLLPVFAVLYGLLLALAWRAWRSRPGSLAVTAGLPCTALAAALLLFVVVNKVFSPQYMLWLLPLLPLLCRPWLLAVAAACALTTLLYPFSYEALLAFAPGAVLLLNLRNALLVGVLASLVAVRRNPARLPRAGRRGPVESVR